MSVPSVISPAPSPFAKFAQTQIVCESIVAAMASQNLERVATEFARAERRWEQFDTFPRGEVQEARKSE